MPDSPPIDDQIPTASGDPEDIHRQLQMLKKLARPMKASWEGQYLAVFSCGVDGRVFRPKGVGYRQERKTDEDLREASSLLHEVSDQLRTHRPDGGRIYLRRAGAFTWDTERQDLVCFLHFPGGRDQRSTREDVRPSSSKSDAKGEARDGSEPTREKTGKESVSREAFEDQITNVARVGRRKARSLWRRGYRSREDIMEASVGELAQVPWVGRTTAGRIKSALSDDDPGHRERTTNRPSSAPGSTDPSIKARQTSLQDFRRPYSIFQSDPLEQLRVEVIRSRATTLRQMVRTSRVPSVEVFSSDFYRFETETRIDDRELTRSLFNPWISMPKSLIRELRTALNDERSSLSGNYLCGREYGFGEHLDDGEDRRSIIEEVFRLLGLTRITPLEKTVGIAELPGLGPVSASGLVTMCHPDGFSLFYKQPYEMTGVGVETLSDLAGWLPAIKRALNAEDGLELARFVRLLYDGGFEMLLRRHNERD